MAFTGKQFPDMAITAIDEMGETFRLNVLKEATDKQKKILLFWYPKDFTFVCPTELHAFQAALPEFEKRNTLVIGASCDTAEVHFAWLSTPKEQGGIEGVTYPLLADTHRILADRLDILDTLYMEGGVIDEVVPSGDNVPYRATFLIDETGKVFHESINDMPLGRNVQEYLRLIDAYAHVQSYGEVCPANWEEGKTAMQATRAGVENYFSNN